MISQFACEPRHEKTCLCHMRTTKAQSDQRLCCSVPRQYSTSSFYIRNSKPLASLCSWAGQLESTLVANPEDRFSRDEAHIMAERLRALALKSFEPPHDKTNKMACAPSKNSDQPGQPPSLIRVLAVHMKKAWVLSYPLSVQRGRLRRLIWVFTGHTFCWFCHAQAQSVTAVSLKLLSHVTGLWYFSSSVNSCSLNAHAQPSSRAICLIFGRTLRLLPYFVCANSEGSGKTAWMHRLACAFAGRLCDKYHNLMSWLIWASPGLLADDYVFFLRNVPRLSIGLPWNEWNNLEGL